MTHAQREEIIDVAVNAINTVDDDVYTHDDAIYAIAHAIAERVSVFDAVGNIPAIVRAHYFTDDDDTKETINTMIDDVEKTYQILS